MHLSSIIGVSTFENLFRPLKFQFETHTIVREAHWPFYFKLGKFRLISSDCRVIVELSDRQEIVECVFSSPVLLIDFFDLLS